MKKLFSATVIMLLLAGCQSRSHFESNKNSGTKTQVVVRQGESVWHAYREQMDQEVIDGVPRVRFKDLETDQDVEIVGDYSIN